MDVTRSSWSTQEFVGQVTKVTETIAESGDYLCTIEVHPVGEEGWHGLYFGPRWKWTVELPTIEYVPKIGDGIVIEIRNLGDRLVGLRFKLKNGPWVQNGPPKPWVFEEYVG
jgi:hypothetical protein